MATTQQMQGAVNPAAIAGGLIFDPATGKYTNPGDPAGGAFPIPAGGYNPNNQGIYTGALNNPTAGKNAAAVAQSGPATLGQPIAGSLMAQAAQQGAPPPGGQQNMSNQTLLPSNLLMGGNTGLPPSQPVTNPTAPNRTPTNVPVFGGTTGNTGQGGGQLPPSAGQQGTGNTGQGGGQLPPPPGGVSTGVGNYTPPASGGYAPGYGGTPGYPGTGVPAQPGVGATGSPFAYPNTGAASAALTPQSSYQATPGQFPASYSPAGTSTMFPGPSDQNLAPELEAAKNAEFNIGGSLLNQFQQQNAAAGNTSSQLQNQYLQSLSPLLAGQGGYTQAQQQAIMAQGGPFGLNSLDPNANIAAFQTGAGNVNQALQGGQGAVNSALTQGQGAANQAFTGGAGAVNSALGTGADALNNALTLGATGADTAFQQGFGNVQGALTGGQGAVNQALTQGAQNVNAQIDPAALRLAPGFQQNLLDQAANAARVQAQAQQQDIQNRAFAAGNSSPMAIAAAQDRANQTGELASADALTQARIQGEQARLGAEQGAEQLQTSNAQQIAARNAAAQLGLESTNVGAQQGLANLGVTSAQQTAARNAASQLGQEQAALGAQQNLAQLGVTNAQENAQRGVGAQLQQEATNVGAQQALLGAGQQATAAQQTQGMDLNQLESGRAQTVANANLQAGQEGRAGLSAQQQQAQQTALTAGQQELGAYGTQAGAVNQAGQQQITNKATNAANSPLNIILGGQAEGGVFKGPVLAEVGEAGPEAIVPVGPAKLAHGGTIAPRFGGQSLAPPAPPVNMPKVPKFAPRLGTPKPSFGIPKSSLGRTMTRSGYQRILPQFDAGGVISDANQDPAFSGLNDQDSPGAWAPNKWQRALAIAGQRIPILGRVASAIPGATADPNDNRPEWQKAVSAVSPRMGNMVQGEYEPRRRNPSREMADKLLSQMGQIQIPQMQSGGLAGLLENVIDPYMAAQGTGVMPSHHSPAQSMADRLLAQQGSAPSPSVSSGPPLSGPLAQEKFWQAEQPYIWRDPVMAQPHNAFMKGQGGGTAKINLPQPGGGGSSGTPVGGTGGGGVPRGTSPRTPPIIPGHIKFGGPPKTAPDPERRIDYGDAPAVPKPIPPPASAPMPPRGQPAPPPNMGAGFYNPDPGPTSGGVGPQEPPPGTDPGPVSIDYGPDPAGPSGNPPGVDPTGGGDMPINAGVPDPGLLNPYAGGNPGGYNPVNDPYGPTEEVGFGANAMPSAADQIARDNHGYNQNADEIGFARGGVFAQKEATPRVPQTRFGPTQIVDRPQLRILGKHQPEAVLPLNNRPGNRVKAKDIPKLTAKFGGR